MTFRAVFSLPPATITYNEFNDWYDGHLDEILAYPGFEEARRYDVTPLCGSECPAVYPFASLYVMSGHPEETNMVVRAGVAAGEIVHPEWFPLPRSSWSFYPLVGGDVETLPDEVIMVTATTPDGVDAAEWYKNTVDSVLAPQLGESRTMQMVASSVNDDAPSTVDVMGVYEAPLRTLDIPAELAGQIIVVGLRAQGPAKTP